MSNEFIFISFFFIPLIILTLLMTRAQRKFLRSVREIINPDKPVSTEEIMNLFVKKVKKPEELFNFLKGDLNNYPGVAIKLYWQHYKNPKLEKEASLVRKLTILSIIIPLVGFIFSFFIAVSR